MHHPSNNRDSEKIIAVFILLAIFIVFSGTLNKAMAQSSDNAEMHSAMNAWADTNFQLTSEFRDATSREQQATIAGEGLANALNMAQWLDEYDIPDASDCEVEALSYYYRATYDWTFLWASVYHTYTAMAGTPTDNRYWVEAIFEPPDFPDFDCLATHEMDTQA